MNLTDRTNDKKRCRDDVSLLLDHLPEPIDLEIDAARRQLYWTDRGDPASGGNSVNRADITADGLAGHVVLATGFHEAIGLTLDPDARRLFVADLGGAIHAVPMDGGDKLLVHRCAGPVTGITIA